jgi:MoxR-like ATPase
MLIPTKRAAFIWGPPGIAKSAIVQQVAAEDGMGFVDLRLSQMDPTDLRGIPFPTMENGIHGVRWSAPMVLPRDLNYDFKTDIDEEEHLIRFENPHNAVPTISVRYIRTGTNRKDLKAEIVSQSNDSFIVRIVDEDGNLYEGRVGWTITGRIKAILALEEFNSAPPSVQAASYQLVLDRRLGEYIVPDGVFIVAMGNRDTDKGVTFRMPTPIANRFVHIEMTVDVTEWLLWAAKSEVHHHIIGYISHFTGSLFVFDAATASRGFCTPRSWVFLSDILNNTPQSKFKRSPRVLPALATGCIGQLEASLFLQFRDRMDTMPPSDDILSGRMTTMTEPDPQFSFAIATGLCYELKRRAKVIFDNGKKESDMDEWFKQADRYIKFITTNFRNDICIVAAKQSITIHKLPFNVNKMTNFTQFAMDNREYILSDEDDH